MNWRLAEKKLDEIKVFDKNPRRITEKGLKDLKTSIDKFGLAEPIVLNTDGTIIGGHARYYALKEQGKDVADCYIPDRRLKAKEVKELNIRLNKNIAGEWDFDILAGEFEVDDLLDWGFGGIEFGIGAEIEFPVLADGDRDPFQQMTFTLADEQAEFIKNALAEAKKTENYKYIETFGNENSNGNVLYLIVSEWVGQRT